MKKLIPLILALLLFACSLFQTNTQVIPTPTLLLTQISPSNTPLPVATATTTDIPYVTIAPTDFSQPTSTSTITIPPASPQPAAKPHFNAGESVKLTTIHMVNTTSGWGMSGPYILATRDGGQSWREVTPPESFPAGANVEAFSAFPDVQTAWVIFSVDSQISAGASVWVTGDGGLTWAASPPLSHTVIGDAIWAEFSSLDDRTGWLAIRGAWAGAGSHYDTQLFRTVDGGGSWSLLTASDSVDIAFQDFTGLVFSDEQTGWLTWQFLGAYISWPASYGVTTDGGSTWESHDLPAPADIPDLYNQYWYCEPYQTNLITTASVRLLVVCSGNQLPSIGFLYITENGGGTWHTYPLPVAPNIGQGDKLIFFDLNKGYLLGQKMFSTNDGGQTWKAITTVAWDHAQFDLINEQIGWAIVSIGENPAALVKTNDGGKSWQVIKPVIEK